MTKNRLYWIDWLKGVACFCVMAGHSRAIANELSASSEWILNELLKPLFNGGLMVCLFAVLSGYLSSLSIGKTKSLFKTLIKRYLRFIPSILITGILVFIIQNTFGFASETMRNVIGIESDIYLTPISFLKTIYQGIIGVLFLGQFTINPAFWMMRSLFAGSVICIFISFISSKKINKAVTPILIFFSIIFSVIIKDHIIMSVLFGFLIGYMKQNNILNKLRGTKFNLFLFIFSFLMAGWGHHLIYEFITENIIPLPATLDAVAKWYACWMLLFVYSLDNLSVITDKLTQKPILILGKCSMGIYCFHNIFIWTVGASAMYYFVKVLGINYDLAFFASLIAIFVFTIAISLFYNRFVERYIDKLLKKVIK